MMAGRLTAPGESGRGTPRGGMQPSVSVVLATCNRHASLVRSIRSILAIEDAFEFVIVDQSEGDAGLPSFLPESGNGSRVRYYRMARRGLSAARNAGIRMAHGEFIVMTDDDCEVPADWVHAARQAFKADPGIAMVFGNVLAGPCDESRGFIPNYVRARPFVGGSAGEKNGIEGMGACMALRRGVWRQVGGFDELLGSGQRFPAGEEGDFALRVLRSGYRVCETPDLEVTHHGFRTWNEGRVLARKYWYGTGAMFGKNLKLAPLSTVRLLVGLGVRFAMGGASLTARSFGRVGTRWTKATAFTRGLLVGLRCGVNPESGCFLRDPRDRSRVSRVGRYGKGRGRGRQAGRSRPELRIPVWRRRVE